MGDKDNKINFINDAVIIGLLTLIGYLVSYNYELGYLSYYKIPENFVQIEITTILKSTGIIMGTLLTIYHILNILPAFYPTRGGETSNNPIRESFRKIYWLFAISIFLILFTEFRLTTVYVSTGLLLLFILLEFVVPIFFHWKVKGYKEKLRVAREADDSVTTFNDVIRNRFGVKGVRIFLILLFIIACVPLVKYIGENRASQQDEYLVINGESPKVLLHIYKDHFVLAPINIKRKEITPNFIFIKQEEGIQESAMFELMNLGELKVKDSRKR